MGSAFWVTETGPGGTETFSPPWLAGPAAGDFFLAMSLATIEALMKSDQKGCFRDRGPPFFSLFLSPDGFNRLFNCVLCYWWMAAHSGLVFVLSCRCGALRLSVEPVTAGRSRLGRHACSLNPTCAPQPGSGRMEGPQDPPAQQLLLLLTACRPAWLGLRF